MNGNVILIEISITKLTAGEYLCCIDVDRRIAIKYILKESGMINGTGLIWLEIVPHGPLL
jgi:hypothetical protein